MLSKRIFVTFFIIAIFLTASLPVRNLSHADLILEGQLFEHGEKLIAEKSGIFNRLLEYYEQFKQEGLKMSDGIKQATEAFCDQSNLIKQFTDEYVAFEEGERITIDFLYSQYAGWAKSGNYKPLSKNIFNNSFEAYSEIQKKRLTEGFVWNGIKLRKYVSQMGLC